MSDGSLSRKKILVVPLSWGLGHATRLIPVISELKTQGAEVLISGGPAQIRIIQEVFPELPYVRLPYLRIRLGTGKSQLLQLFLQVPGIAIYLFREFFALRKLQKTEKFDGIISDNCYALRHRKVHSVIISHQLQIEVPGSIKFMQGLINTINHKLLRSFDACWIPDLDGSTKLAGRLSQRIPPRMNSRYIGLLSRFGALTDHKETTPIKTGSILFIISGPESQRSYFENLIRREVQSLPEKYSFKVICGLPELTSAVKETGWYPHVSTEELYNFITEADTIICRSGYSTIMDLVIIGKSALLIPTPGQTEQEYLAHHLSEKGLFSTVSQDEFRLKNILATLSDKKKQKTDQPGKQSNDLLKEAVRSFLISLK